MSRRSRTWKNSRPPAASRAPPGKRSSRSSSVNRKPAGRRHWRIPARSPARSRSSTPWQADPNVDIVLLQEALPRATGSDRSEHYIAMANDYAATKATKPIAFVNPISHSQTDYSRALRARAPHVSFLQEANKALRAIANAARREELERLALTSRRDVVPTPGQRGTVRDLQELGRPGGPPVHAAPSKEVSRGYGIV